MDLRRIVGLPATQRRGIAEHGPWCKRLVYLSKRLTRCFGAFLSSLPGPLPRGREHEEPARNPGRVAGFCCLLLILIGQRFNAIPGRFLPVFSTAGVAFSDARKLMSRLDASGSFASFTKAAANT